MYLEKLIKKLEEARKVCRTNIEKKNVEINIKICEMQIKIREGYRNKSKKIKVKR